MRKILLTGAGPHGFVGRNIAPYLAEKYTLYTPSSEVLDLCDLKALDHYVRVQGIDTIIHSAVHNTIARGSEKALQNDLQMYFNIEKVGSALRRVIYFGSGAEFDKRLPMDMVTEDEIGRSVPTDYYGLAKYIVNLNARANLNTYNMRLFGIFGKYEYWPLKFISNLCCKAVFDLPLSVRKNCMFDFLYVDDLGKIVCYFVENELIHKDYNICTGTPIDLITIANMVNKAAGKDLPINILSSGWNLPYTASNARLMKEIGLLELTPMQEAISQLYKYYYDNRNAIDINILRDSK